MSWSSYCLYVLNALGVLIKLVFNGGVFLLSFVCPVLPGLDFSLLRVYYCGWREVGRSVQMFSLLTYFGIPKTFIG